MLMIAAVVVLVVLALIFVYKWKASKQVPKSQPCTDEMVHHLDLNPDTIQNYELQEKDSLDEHLDVLTKKLAEKEISLRFSKTKLRETRDEMRSLDALDGNVHEKYRDVMDALRQELMGNEKECRKLQDQIEWVSRRRAELNDEIRNSQRLYGKAATDLACNLAELQKGRTDISDKPCTVCHSRLRKEPTMPRTSPYNSIIIKSSPPLSEESFQSLPIVDKRD